MHYIKNSASHCFTGDDGRGPKGLGEMFHPCKAVSFQDAFELMMVQKGGNGAGEVFVGLRPA